MDMKKILKDTAILTVITIISGMLLGVAFNITNPIIQARKMEEKAAAFRSIFSQDTQFEDGSALLEKAPEVLTAAGCSETITDVMVAKDAAGNVIGYAMSISTNGFGGELVIAYGYGVDGTSMGIDILTSSETSGLGSRASEPEFKDQFAGKLVEAFSVVKGGAAADTEINAISGATRTSNAVTGAVNAGIIFGQYCTENN